MRSRSVDDMSRLFELSLDLLAIVGADDRVVAVNASWERVLGYSPDELEATNLIDLVHPDDVTDGRRSALEPAAGGHPVQLENRYRHADGHWVWLRWSSVTSADDGTIYAAARDVTDERRAIDEAAAAITRLEAAQRAARIGSWELDLRTGARFYTREMYVMNGLDAETDRPWDLRDLLAHTPAADHGALLRAARRVLSEPGRQRVEFHLLHAPGRVYLSTLEAERDANGTPIVVRGTTQDVTHQRLVTRQQQEIARLGQLALAGTDLRHLFDEVCRVAVELLGTDVADILALQGDGSLAFAACHGRDGPRRGTAVAADEDSVVRRALAAGTPIVIADWLAEQRFPDAEALRGEGIRCSAIVPIPGRDGPFGALTTHALAPGIVDPAQNTAFLDALATLMATAVERLRHEAEIEGLATLRGRLVAENLEAEERVRRRISEQLHDGALQDLLAARQDLVEAENAADSDARNEMLGYARDGVERAVRLLRDAVHALHPLVLQHGGLEAAMQAAADQAARQGGFRAEVVVDPAAMGWRDELVMSLARELLTNAAKHAQAGLVRVTLARQGDLVALEVADDGRGLDAAAVAAAPMNGHIGLASLTQRVEAVGGTVDLSGSAGAGGTTVLARLPIG